MKLKTSALLGLTLLAANASRSAPKRKTATKLAPITEVQVSQDDGGHGGFNGGAGVSWTFRSNGTVSRSQSLSTFEALEAGNTFIPDTSGRFDKEDFTQLVNYLTQSRVTDLQIPHSTVESPGLNIGVVRGGKLKVVRITDAAPPMAQTEGWVTLKLVQALTMNVDWKNPAGLSINTGINGTFKFAGQPSAPDEAPAVAVLEAPAVAVLNAAGKNVGYLAQTGESAAFRLVLPPGTYHLQVTPPSDASQLKGSTWDVPATVQVEAGRTTTVLVRQQKAPVAP